MQFNYNLNPSAWPAANLRDRRTCGRTIGQPGSTLVGESKQGNCGGEGSVGGGRKEDYDTWARTGRRFGITACNNFVSQFDSVYIKQMVVQQAGIPDIIIADCKCTMVVSIVQ